MRWFLRRRSTLLSPIASTINQYFINRMDVAVLVEEEQATEPPFKK
jgi:hypothetical protein